MSRVIGERRAARAAMLMSRRMRYWAGEFDGLGYRWSGRHPELEVSDNVLADRVRSELGPLEKELDVPRVHVMAYSGVVLLHGEVGTDDEAAEIELAASRMPGVKGVESFLHVGLGPNDTRPSMGRQIRHDSEARTALIEAAIRAGAPAGAALWMTRAVLATFCSVLPDTERRKVARHLPIDARLLTRQVRRIGSQLGEPRTPAALVGAMVMASRGEVSPVVVEQVVVSVLGELKRRVPEEVANVEAVLPQDLKRWWRAVDHKEAVV